MKNRKINTNLLHDEDYVVLTMPDGSSHSIWLPRSKYTDENINKISNVVFDEWSKESKEKPGLFGHIKLEQKCPKCGDTLYGKYNRSYVRCWCFICGYRELKKIKNEIQISGSYSYRILPVITNSFTKNGYVIKSSWRTMAGAPPIGHLMEKDGAFIELRCC